MSKKYFFINSNISFSDEGKSCDHFMRDISGNTGNSYITYSVIKILYGQFQSVDDIKNLWFYQPNKRDIDRINSEYSKVILILQDNLRLFDSYFNHQIYEGLADFFKKVKIPIVVFSLGSNSFNGEYKDLHNGVSKDLVNMLKVLSDKTSSFGVRGNYTLEVLNNLKITNAKVVGCPSYFETGRDRIIHKKNNSSDLKIVAGGYFENNRTKDVHYVLQDEKLFIKAIKFPAERILPSDFEGFDPNNSYVRSLLEAYIDKRMSVFSDIDKWKEFDRNFDFYIGTRVHGAIAAINSGLPAIITNKDSRAEEMSNLFGIDWRDVDVNASPQELYQSINVDKMNNSYNGLYDNFVEWLGENDLTIDPKLSDKNSSKKQNTASICKEGYEDNHALIRAIISFSSQNYSKTKYIEDNVGKSLAEMKRKIENLSQASFVTHYNLKTLISIASKEKKRIAFATCLSRILSAFVIGKVSRKKFRDLVKKKILS